MESTKTHNLTKVQQKLTNVITTCECRIYFECVACNRFLFPSFLLLESISLVASPLTTLEEVKMRRKKQQQQTHKLMAF